MSDPVTALARKWCPKHWGNEVAWREYPCICDRLQSAVREALEEALGGYPFGGLDGLLKELEESLQGHGVNCANPETCGPLGCLLAKISHQRKAIAALRGGTGWVSYLRSLLLLSGYSWQL